MIPKVRSQTKQVVAPLLLLALVCLAVPSYADDPACWLSFAMFNRNRHIVGGVNAECSGGCVLRDTEPWGNWGVDSNFGARDNTTQFKGWKSGSSVDPCGENISDSAPEWNSCTDD